MRPWFPVVALPLAACADAVEIPVDLPRADPTELWLAHLESCLAPTGVDYDCIDARRPLLHHYLAWVGEHGPEADGWSEGKQKRRVAFMLNAYNAAVIEGVLRHRPLDSVRDVGAGLWSLRPGAGFFLGQKFRVDQDWQTLHVLEHQDIVGRYQDPLVHVGLNCASRSCPPLRAWREDDLHADLRAAMREWLKGDGLQCDEAGCEVSSIFHWNEDDFLDWSTAETLCAWLEPYTAGSDRAWMKAHAEDCPLEPLPFDWSLNAVAE